LRVINNSNEAIDIMLNGVKKGRLYPKGDKLFVDLPAGPLKARAVDFMDAVRFSKELDAVDKQELTWTIETVGSPAAAAANAAPAFPAAGLPPAPDASNPFGAPAAPGGLPPAPGGLPPAPGALPDANPFPTTAPGAAPAPGAPLDPNASPFPPAPGVPAAADPFPPAPPADAKKPEEKK